MKIALYGRQFGKKFLPKFMHILSFFEKRDVDVFIYNKFAEHLEEEYNLSLDEKCIRFSSCESLRDTLDVLLSIGGDGTFLSASNLVIGTDIPVLGVNSGRLGFLSVIGDNEIDSFLEKIVKKEYKIKERTLLELKEVKGHSTNLRYALNEVGVLKLDMTSTIRVRAYLGDELIMSYWSDGLLVATPTGSTAYSLSAGGPIVAPDCANLLLVPVSPHNLTMRPIVIPDDQEIRLKVVSRSSHFVLSLDSKNEKILSGTEIVVKKADLKVKTVSFDEVSFYKTLQNKLMWGIDRRN